MHIPIPERVHNGVTALDTLAEESDGQVVPYEWRDTFTPDVIANLNIASAFHCVLGELYGDFCVAPEPLITNPRDERYESTAYNNGFAATHLTWVPFKDRRAEEELLTQAWRNYLTPGGLT